MATIEEKLETILATMATKEDLQMMATKEDVKGINDRIDALSLDVNSRIDRVESDVSDQKLKVAENTDRIDGFEATVTAQGEIIEALQSKLKKEKSLADLRSRMNNLLLFGDDDDNPDEEPSESIERIRNFLKNVLKLPNADSIMIDDGHRLRLRKKATRTSRPKGPLIFRVVSAIDRKLIFNRARDCLGAYNTEKGTNYYVKRHLPKHMQDQKKKLLPTFNKAKRAKKEAKFQINFDTGDYELYIDGQLYTG